MVVVVIVLIVVIAVVVVIIIVVVAVIVIVVVTVIFVIVIIFVMVIFILLVVFIIDNKKSIFKTKNLIIAVGQKIFPLIICPSYSADLSNPPSPSLNKCAARAAELHSL